MDTAAEQVDLEAGLALERDDTSLRHRAARRPQPFDDADAGMRDVAHAEQLADEQHGQRHDHVRRTSHFKARKTTRCDSHDHKPTPIN